MSKTQIAMSNSRSSAKSVMSARTSVAAGTVSPAIASISGDRSIPVTAWSPARPASTAPVPQPSSSRLAASGR